jgi:ElaB/YqjD/DUF883 family membrane-anchored ribosome-binding protein
METTPSQAAASVSAAASRTAQDAGDSLNNVKSMAADEIKALIADVEELVARIADLKDAEVVRMRERVLQAVGAAKDSLTDGAESLRRRAKSAISGADDYVRESPWAAVGLAALVGAVVGILVTRRS